MRTAEELGVIRIYQRLYKGVRVISGFCDVMSKYKGGFVCIFRLGRWFANSTQ